MTIHLNRLTARALPQLSGMPFLTDGGLETTLIFHDGIDLPCFAAFTLLGNEEGRATVRAYYQRYLDIAREAGSGFILEAPTWRASSDWGAKLGYSDTELDDINRDAIRLLVELRETNERESAPIVISGNIGPRGDGYQPGEVMSATQAEDYHARQVSVFAATDADCVTAMTITNVEEAIGITRAAAQHDIPAVISFTLETDGRLPTGQTLAEAVETVDAATSGGPAYYMINCAHPSHFDHLAAADGAWRERIRGLRANASRRSHEELDNAEDLDDGNPVELGEEYAALCRRFPNLTVFGGCCGTDHRHLSAIARSCIH